MRVSRTYGNARRVKLDSRWYFPATASPYPRTKRWWSPSVNSERTRARATAAVESMLGSLPWFILNVHEGSNYCPALPSARIPSVHRYSGRRVARRAECALEERSRIPYSHKGILLTRLLIARRLCSATKDEEERVCRVHREEFRSHGPHNSVCHSWRYFGISGPSSPSKRELLHVASLAREIIPQDIHWHYRVRIKHFGSLIKTHTGRRTPRRFTSPP